MTYDELVTNIRNYTEVNANVFTNAVINTFITMAENQILREIDLDVFKLEVSGNMTSGNKFLTAPSNILTHRYMMITSGSDQIFLDFRDTSFMKEYWPNGASTGVPKYYSVWDQNTFYVAPTPNASFVVELGYIYRPAQLSRTRRPGSATMLRKRCSTPALFRPTATPRARLRCCSTSTTPTSRPCRAWASSSRAVVGVTSTVMV